MSLNNRQWIAASLAEFVNNFPDRIALRWAGQTLTYRDLDERVEQIARELSAHSFIAGEVVAVDIRSPLEMVGGSLAVLKAGGIYMPIDLTNPRQMVNDQLANSGAKWLLSQGENRITALDTKEKSTTGNLQSAALIYAAHSVGRAQGIVLSHEKMLNWLAFNIETLKVDFAHTLFVAAPALKLRFPLWLANLVCGGTVHFDEARDRITSIVCPLHLLPGIVSDSGPNKASLEGIKNIVTLGEEGFDAEALKLTLKEKSVRWHNYFGFPDITMITTLKGDLSGGDGEVGHVGKPGPGTGAYILNQAGQQVAVGLPGELYVSGSGMMAAYYRNEPLNAAHFVDNPFRPGKKMFRTGYRASWLPDGKISLSRRSDDLVTVNGYRITLREVEHALLRHPQIDEASVVQGRANGGLPWLRAFLVLKEEEAAAILPDKIEEELKASLPAEIFPIGWVMLSSLPRSPEGAVDRRYLEESRLLDTRQVKAFEAEISKQQGVGQAAVTAREKIDKPLPLHLKDYLPEIRQEAAAVSPSLFAEPSLPDDTARPLAVISGGELEHDEGDPWTLAEALKRAAVQNGDNGIIYIRPDGSDYFQTYAGLLAEAQRVLTGLRGLGLKPADRVIFQFDRSQDFVSAFWGCVLGGFVPVPMMVPRSLQKPNNETATLQGVWQTLDRPLVLTNKNLAPALHSFFKDFRLGTIETLRDNEADQNWHPGDPGDLAILLFTSGSTGKPKGVQQCHRAVLSREKGTIVHNHFNDRDISLNWMPLEHVGGVVMFHIRDVYAGCQQIQARTEYILAEPLRWLDIISRCRATITWAPNFAYALINDRLESVSDGSERNWDLSSMRFILNGGEAINARSTRKFVTLLAPYGLPATAMKPAWGMSETCSGVVYSHSFTAEPETGVHNIDKHSLGGSIRKSTSEADCVNFVELGEPIPGISIRVADSRNQAVPEGVVGHLQIRGLTVTGGYYHNPELNREVFTPDGWFDTGDLGFILKGRMTITGRAKDVIIVNGINLNSVEIEAAVEEVEGVETSFTAACAVRDEAAETDRVVVFYSSRFADFSQQLPLIPKIKRKFAETFGMNLDYVVPIARQDVPKTAIGKIQRTKLAKMFEAGSFDAIVKKIDIGLENENTLPAWFFTKTWEKRTLSAHEPRESARTCLVFEDGLGLARELSVRLERRLCRCIQVKTGAQFKKVADDHYEIDARQPEHYNRLLGDLVNDCIEIDDIFHLFGFVEAGREAGDDFEDEIGVIKDGQYRGVYSLLALIQALHIKGGDRSRSLRLFVISRHARFTPGDTTAAVEQCSLSGFLKCIPLELSWLQCRHIDLGDSDSPGHADCLIREWQSLQPEREVAYRHGERFVPVLERVDVEAEKLEAPLKHGGLYLVTGGLGGIGSRVCRWLSLNWQARLILVGRTKLPSEEEWGAGGPEDAVLKKRLSAYREIEAANGELMYAAGDVADPTFLKEAVARAESRWGDPLSGIFHLAGYGNLEYHWTVMDRHRIVAETPQTFEDMFQAKVYGTIALHRLLKDNRTAIFVAFSSTASVFGASTFSAYAAANSFLDGFCLMRRANGYPLTFCLNWSSWDNIGMAENNPFHLVQTMRASGYETITPKRGLASLWIGLGRPHTGGEFLIGLNGSKYNIRRHLNGYPAERQILKVFYSPVKGTDLSAETLSRFISRRIGVLTENKNVTWQLHPLAEIPTREGRIDYRRLAELEKSLQYSAMESLLPRNETERRLARIWQELLGKEQIGVNDDFFTLGGNSLKATILAARIHKEFKRHIPLKEIFKTPTIKGLAQYLETVTEGGYSEINPGEKKDYYTLSPAQRRFYILQQMDTAMTNYNIPAAFELAGTVDIKRLEETFSQLIHRHEGLRTAFDKRDGQPVQRIYGEVDFKIEYDDTPRPEIDRERTVLEFIRPFDLAGAPLLRVGLVKLAVDEYFLMVDIHHIAADGISVGILIEEFVAMYRGDVLPPLEIQYRDYSEWLNRLLESGAIEGQRDYWLEEYSGKLPVLRLPADYEQPVRPSFTGHFVKFELEPEALDRLREFTLKEDATLFMVLLTVFYVLLAKISGHGDIIVGTALAGRRHPALEPVMGLFLNTLALRNYPKGSKRFGAFLREVMERTLAAFENQDYPFDEVVARVVGKRSRGQQPIFSVLFGLQNIDISEFSIPGLTLKPYRFHSKTTKFDMMLMASEWEDRLLFNIEYSTELFKEETVKNVAEYFKKILSMVMAEPGIRIDEINIMPADEVDQIMSDIKEYQGQGEVDFDV